MKSAHGQMAFDRVDRYKEDGQFKCRKGKSCNGRCIPKDSECGVGTKGSGGFEGRTQTAKKIAGGLGVALAAGAVVGGGMAAGKAIEKNGAEAQARMSRVRTARGNQQLQRRGRGMAKAAHEKASANAADVNTTGTLSQRAVANAAAEKTGKRLAKANVAVETTTGRLGRTVEKAKTTSSGAFSARNLAKVGNKVKKAFGQ